MATGIPFELINRIGYTEPKKRKGLISAFVIVNQWILQERIKR